MMGVLAEYPGNIKRAHPSSALHKDKPKRYICRDCGGRILTMINETREELVISLYCEGCYKL